MYESPVKLIYKNVEQTLENGIIKAIQKVDIEVNKIELQHALAYDKYQYEKGFNDGVKAEIERRKMFDVVVVVHGKWHPRTDRPKQEIFICSVCGGWAYSPWIGSRKNPQQNWCKYKFCPNCGADMRGGNK